MQLPLNERDTLFEKLLQDLPMDLAESAREFKAFTRSRKLKNPQDVIRAVLLYSGLDQSLREVAGTMTLVLGEPITDQAISDRLRATKPWLQVLLRQMLELPDEVRSKFEGRRLVVVDATNITGVQASGTEYRIHTKIDLLSFELLEIIVSDAKLSESLVNFHHQAGDLVLGDRAYIRRKRVLDLNEQGVEIIGRFSPTQCVVEDVEGNKIEWQERLAGLSEGVRTTLEVRLHDGKRKTVKAWLHIYRKSAEKAAQARRKARRKAQQEGRTIQALTLQLCDYVMILTTLSVVQLSCQTVLELYRMRWQIELVFKRWKSLLGAAKQRCKRMSELGWSWVYGKLLYCLLIERRAGRVMGWEKLQPEREQSLWRIWKIVKAEVVPMILGSQNWQAIMWVEAIKVLGERKRKRDLQSIPQKVREYLKREFVKGGQSLEAIF